MSTYIAAVESACDSLGTLFKKDFTKGLAGFFSIRFTSGIAANLSMSYSPDPATSPGRSYPEIFSLFALYPSVKDFDDVVAPVQKKSIDQFQVWPMACWFVTISASDIFRCYRDVSIGVNIWRHRSRRFSTRSMTLSFSKASQSSRRLRRSSIPTGSCGTIIWTKRSGLLYEWFELSFFYARYWTRM